jgi:hypothetical protein
MKLKEIPVYYKYNKASVGYRGNCTQKVKRQLTTIIFFSFLFFHLHFVISEKRNLNYNGVSLATGAHFFDIPNILQVSLDRSINRNKSNQIFQNNRKTIDFSRFQTKWSRNSNWTTFLVFIFFSFRLYELPVRFWMGGKNGNIIINGERFT